MEPSPEPCTCTCSLSTRSAERPPCWRSQGRWWVPAWDMTGHRNPAGPADRPARRWWGAVSPSDTGTEMDKRSGSLRHRHRDAPEKRAEMEDEEQRALHRESAGPASHRGHCGKVAGGQWCLHLTPLITKESVPVGEASPADTTSPTAPLPAGADDGGALDRPHQGHCLYPGLAESTDRRAARSGGGRVQGRRNGRRGQCIGSEAAPRGTGFDGRLFEDPCF